MASFTLSVIREHHGARLVRGRAGLIWYSAGQRQEAELADIRLEIAQGPSRLVLAEALRALADELELEAP